MSETKKAYWVAHVDVRDLDAYQEYVRLGAAAFEKYGAKFLARAGRHEEIEGALGRARHVVIEFKDLETARACYNSPEYAAARAKREPVATATITLVEGV